MIEPIKEGHTISDSLKQWLADEFNRVRKGIDEVHFNEETDEETDEETEGETVEDVILKWYDLRPDRNHESVTKIFLASVNDVVCFSPEWNRWLYFDGKRWQHDSWLPASARKQLRRIIKRIQVQIHQSREYGYAHQGS